MLFLLSFYCSMLLCFYFKHFPMPFKHQLAIAVRAKVAICFGLAQRFLLFLLRRRFHQEGAQFPQHIQRYKHRHEREGVGRGRDKGRQGEQCHNGMTPIAREEAAVQQSDF